MVVRCLFAFPPQVEVQWPVGVSHFELKKLCKGKQYDHTNENPECKRNKMKQKPEHWQYTDIYLS